MRSPDDPCILVVSPIQEDFDSLSGILEDERYELHRATCFAEGLTTLRSSNVAIVICQQELPDGDWKTLLEELRNLAAQPLFILCSRLADDLLWAEVLNLGGYDLILTPFDPAAARHAVMSAWRTWQKNRQRGRDNHGI